MKYTYSISTRHYTFKNAKVPPYWVAYLFAEAEDGHEHCAALVRSDDERRAVAALRVAFPEETAGVPHSFAGVDGECQLTL